MNISLGSNSRLKGEDEGSVISVDDCCKVYERLRRDGAVAPNSLLSCLRGSTLVFPKAPARPVGFI